LIYPGHWVKVKVTGAEKRICVSFLPIESPLFSAVFVTLQSTAERGSRVSAESEAVGACHQDVEKQAVCRQSVMCCVGPVPAVVLV